MTTGLHAIVKPSTPRDDRETLVREVARALHAAGAPAHRLEQTVHALAERMGLEARVFSTPTAIYASFGPEEDARTALVRADRSSLDLGRLADVDEVSRSILDGELDVAEAILSLKTATSAPPRWGPGWVLPSFGLASAAATVLLGGSAGDIVAAGFVGLCVGLTVLASAYDARIGPVTDLVAGLLAAVIAGAFSRALFPVDAGLVTVASLIVLVPGLSLTTAVTELSTRHLVSGTARLSGAFITFASLGLGALAGGALISVLPAIPAQPIPLPSWALWVAWPVAAISFVPLMQARLKDTPLIAVSTGVGIFATQFASATLTPALAAALASLAVALTSNALGRVTDRPTAVPLVPALFLLVPGSTGFRSLVELLDSDLQAGLDNAIAALITAAALATGVIIAQAIAPTRRAL